jgi:acyl carrier protein
LLCEAGLDVSSVVLPPGVSTEATAPQAVLVARRVPVAVPPTAVPAPATSRFALAEAVVSEVVAAVFEMPVAAVSGNGLLSFSELGGDSLLSAELAAKLGSRLGLSLKTTAIFNHPNIPALAAYLVEEFPDAPLWASESGDPAPVAAPPVVAPPVMTPPVGAGGVDSILRALESGVLSVDEALRRIEFSQ